MKATLIALPLVLAGGPILAQAADTRATAPVVGHNGLAADSNVLFYLGIAAVAAGIFLLVEDDDDEPVSA